MRSREETKPAHKSGGGLPIVHKRVPFLRLEIAKSWGRSHEFRRCFNVLGAGMNGQGQTSQDARGLASLPGVERLISDL